MKKLKEVTKYVDSIRHLFLCEEFDLFIVNVIANENCAATIEVRYDYLDATMKIYPEFYKANESLQKKILVHEMCHFITLLQDGLIEDLLDGKLVTLKHATAVTERANSWIERILCTYLKKELGL